MGVATFGGQFLAIATILTPTLFRRRATSSSQVTRINW